MGEVHDTSTNDKATEVTNISTLLVTNNKPEQTNTTGIILENNENDKVTFI